MSKENEPKNRRTSEQIVDLIFDALLAARYTPISYISRKSGVDWRTCKRYLDLIKHIQSKQTGAWLEKDSIGDQSGYRRKSLKRGPRKGKP